MTPTNHPSKFDIAQLIEPQKGQQTVKTEWTPKELHMYLISLIKHVIFGEELVSVPSFG